MNCGIGEDSWESLGLQGNPTSYPKGNQSWIFIGRTDAEAETPIIWPSDVNNWLPGKDPDAGKEWRQEEKETTEDEIVGCHYWFDRHELEQAPGVGDEAWRAIVHGVAKNQIQLSELRTSYLCELSHLFFPSVLCTTPLYWHDKYSFQICSQDLTLIPVVFSCLTLKE